MREIRDVEGAVPYMVCENINHVGNNASLMNQKRVTRGRPYGVDCRDFVGQAVFFIQFSSFKQGAGSAFLCDQNLSSCSPNSRPQNVSSCTATMQAIQFGIISLGYLLFLWCKVPLILIPKNGSFVAEKMQQLQNYCQIKSKIICLYKSAQGNLCKIAAKFCAVKEKNKLFYFVSKRESVDVIYG